MTSSTRSGPASYGTDATRPLRGVSLALTLMIVALWGGNAVAVTYSVDWLPPVAVAAVRFALGTIVMLGWCWVEGGSLRFQRGEATICLIAAFLLFVQISTFNIGVQATNSTHGILLVNTYIFGVCLMEQLILRTTRLRMLQWAGMIVAGVGVICIVQVRDTSLGSVPRSFLRGDLVLMFSAFVLAIRVLYVRHAVQTISSSKLILWHNAISVLMFAGFSFATESMPQTAPPLSAILGLLYQGLIVAGLCFVIHARLLTHHSASQISVFFFATPVFGVFFAIALRGEPLTGLIVLGAACVSIGIWLATARIGHASRAADETN